MRSADAVQRAVAAHQTRFAEEPTLVAVAPGRVNLIGEHTDYNDGFCLPMALPMATVIAASASRAAAMHVDSEGFGSADIALDLAAADAAPGGSSPLPGWARYLHGTAAMLAERGHAVGAWDGSIATDIPTGASLSSSAALEVAAALAFTRAARIDGASTAGGSGTIDAPTHPGAIGSQTRPGTIDARTRPGAIDAIELARVGQAVENRVFGLPSGILDQLASAASIEGHASLIDCRELTLRHVPVSVDVTVVIIDTGTRRELVESAYADRQQTCARVADALGVAALRDATLADLDRLDPSDEVGRRRAHHVITENERTLQAAAALEAHDHRRVGALMSASHASLRDDYEVSGPALDAAVELAEQAPGCLGARMTGGGFAGCTVALVQTDAVDAFVAAVIGGHQPVTAQPATAPLRLYPVRPGAGARIL
ncbi:MAG: galactokinase [Acidimicrobiales bacterium]